MSILSYLASYITGSTHPTLAAIIFRDKEQLERYRYTTIDDLRLAVQNLPFDFFTVKQLVNLKNYLYFYSNNTTNRNFIPIAIDFNKIPQFKAHPRKLNKLTHTKIKINSNLSQFNSTYLEDQISEYENRTKNHRDPRTITVSILDPEFMALINALSQLMLIHKQLSPTVTEIVKLYPNNIVAAYNDCWKKEVFKKFIKDSRNEQEINVFTQNYKYFIREAESSYHESKALAKFVLISDSERKRFQQMVANSNSQNSKFNSFITNNSNKQNPFTTTTYYQEITKKQTHSQDTEDTINPK